ncbi:MAG: PepSY domain-containing protein [Peptoniphilaceae bacterium]
MIKNIIIIFMLSLFLVGCQGKNDNVINNNNLNTKKEVVENNKALSDLELSVEDNNLDKGPFLYINDDNVKIKVEEVFSKFKEVHPEANLVSISLDSDNKVYKYELEGNSKDKNFEFEINTKTGEIIKDHSEIDDEDEFLSLDIISKIDEIIEKAYKDAGVNNYFNTAWEVSVDDSIAVMDLEFKDQDMKEIEYKYNILSGELIEKELD